MTRHVAVIGAGIVGISTAIWLRRAGAEVTVVDRGKPGTGELNYAHIFRKIDTLGWKAPLGAEYKPGGPTEATLGWMENV